MDTLVQKMRMSNPRIDYLYSNTYINHIPMNINMNNLKDVLYINTIIEELKTKLPQLLTLSNLPVVKYRFVYDIQDELDKYNKYVGYSILQLKIIINKKIPLKIIEDIVSNLLKSYKIIDEFKVFIRDNCNDKTYYIPIRPFGYCLFGYSYYVAILFIVRDPIVNIKHVYKQSTCIVCMDKKPLWYFEDCGHLCLCGSCRKTHSFNMCPLCREKTSLKLFCGEKNLKVIEA
jgi:hypothetical protein